MPFDFDAMVRVRMLQVYGSLLIAASLVGLLFWYLAIYHPPDYCAQLRLHCDLGRIEENARRGQLCDVVNYCESVGRTSSTCESLLRALQKAEAPDGTE